MKCSEKTLISVNWFFLFTILIWAINLDLTILLIKALFHFLAIYCDKLDFQAVLLLILIKLFTG